MSNNYQLPIFQRVFAKSVSMGLVSVQPMKAPTLNVMYMDYQLGRTERKMKIEKILTKIKNKLDKELS